MREHSVFSRAGDGWRRDKVGYKRRCWASVGFMAQPVSKFVGAGGKRRNRTGIRAAEAWFWLDTLQLQRVIRESSSGSVFVIAPYFSAGNRGGLVMPMDDTCGLDKGCFFDPNRW